MLIDIHIVPQTAVHIINLLNTLFNGSLQDWPNKANKHAQSHYTFCMKLQKVLKLL